MFREFDQKDVQYQFIRASDPVHYSMILQKFPVFSLFNREIAAPAPETSSPQTACTTNISIGYQNFCWLANLCKCNVSAIVRSDLLLCDADIKSDNQPKPDGCPSG